MSKALDFLSQINEVTAKRKLRIRNKRIQTAFVCPPFYKKVGTARIQDTPQEARRLSFIRRRAWRYKTHTSLPKLLAKREKSLAYRQNIFGKERRPTGQKPNEFLAVAQHAGAMKRLLATRMAQQSAEKQQAMTLKGKAPKGIKVTVPTTTPISQGPAAGRL